MPDPDLYLVTPPIDDADAFRPALEEACAGDGVAAVLLRLAPADERTLINRVKALAPSVQARGIALILADPGNTDLATLVTRGGADGAHAGDPARLRVVRERLKDGRSLGAGGLRTKHDAMEAGEIGADYVMFGEPRQDGSLPPLDLVVERAEWWVDIFQIPCVAFAPSLADIPVFARTGIEFVAVGDAVWTCPDGPGAAVARAREAASELAP